MDELDKKDKKDLLNFSKENNLTPLSLTTMVTDYKSKNTIPKQDRKNFTIKSLYSIPEDTEDTSIKPEDTNLSQKSSRKNRVSSLYIPKGKYTSSKLNTKSQTAENQTVKNQTVKSQTVKSQTVKNQTPNSRTGRKGRTGRTGKRTAKIRTALRTTTRGQTPLYV